jgi:hypothetical protein
MPCGRIIAGCWWPVASECPLSKVSRAAGFKIEIRKVGKTCSASPLSPGSDGVAPGEPTFLHWRKKSFDRVFGRQSMQLFISR